MLSRKSLLLCVLCTLIGVLVARLPTTIAQINSHFGEPGKVDWNTAFEDVRRLILSKYVEKPDEEALLKGAIKGMTDALNDPYTEFVPPADRAAFEKDLTGQFVGIGATVNVREGWLTIVYPLEDSPAYKAGLIPDDRIAAINDKSTQGLTVEECVKQLLGEPDTLVTLSVERFAGEPEGTPKKLEVKINRQPISATSVKGFRWNGAANGSTGAWEHLIDPARAIAYVRLTQFTPDCADEVLAAVELAGKQARTQSGLPSVLVLDLRDNPGGLLEEALQLVDMFVDSGTMLSTKGRTGSGQKFRARAGGDLLNLPTIILVNQSSASASEIVSGALQEAGKAVVLGTRTFGKGLVQRIEPLERVPGAELKLTEQHYYLPSGRLIQRTDTAKTWGVDPNPGFYVALTDDESTDLFLTRREMDVIRPANAPQLAPRPIPGFKPRPQLSGPDAKWNDPTWLNDGLRDKQLAAAMRSAIARAAAGPNVAFEPTGENVPDQVKAISIVELTRLERLHDRYNREIDRLEKRMAALEEGHVAAANPQTDLWTDTVDLTGGKIEIFDKDGKRIATLDVTGPDVERWLIDADVKPQAGSPVPKDAARAVPEKK